MISVGVTGHRPHRLKVSERKLAARVRSVLRMLSGLKTFGDELDIISPLAEGCDRIVAGEAIALGQHLTVLLPFPQRDYEATFIDPKATRTFRALLKQADVCLVLGGKCANAEAGYVAVGDVTLARSDVVLTIWDGKPAQGRGGTPEILQSALDWNIPIIWINAVRDLKPKLIRRRPRSGKGPPRLSTAAARAEVVSLKALRSVLRERQSAAALT